jgi:hypothetical protein
VLELKISGAKTIYWSFITDFSLAKISKPENLNIHTIILMPNHIFQIMSINLGSAIGLIKT